MRTRDPIVHNIPPHQYKLEVVGDEIVLWFNLHGLNGIRETPRKGLPNAEGWRRSIRTFPALLDGVTDAHNHAEAVFRIVDEDTRVTVPLGHKE